MVAHHPRMKIPPARRDHASGTDKTSIFPAFALFGACAGWGALVAYEAIGAEGAIAFVAALTAVPWMLRRLLKGR